MAYYSDEQKTAVKKDYIALRREYEELEKTEGWDCYKRRYITYLILDLDFYNNNLESLTDEQFKKLCEVVNFIYDYEDDLSLTDIIDAIGQRLYREVDALDDAFTEKKLVDYIMETSTYNLKVLEDMLNL